jgi:hypothetical protein
MSEAKEALRRPSERQRAGRPMGFGGAAPEQKER